jgi:hypothetical protein
MQFRRASCVSQERVQLLSILKNVNPLILVQIDVLRYLKFYANISCFPASQQKSKRQIANCAVHCLMMHCVTNDFSVSCRILLVLASIKTRIKSRQNVYSSLNRYSSVIFSVGKSEDEKRRDEERGK